MNMSIENFGFCENDTISHKIHHLVANHLLGVEQLNKVVCRYDDMRRNFNRYPKDFAETESDEWIFSEDLGPFKPKGWSRCYSDTTGVPISITHPDFLDLTLREKNRGAIGLDLPTWFCQTQDAPFVMIVAQDPLRDPEWYGDKKDEQFVCNEAVVSSPFGLQDAHHRENGRGGRRMWLLVKALLSKGYNVYLTDCKKYFVYSHSETDEYTTPEKVELYRRILNEEIKIINPLLIVTLGHTAERYCRKMLGSDCRLSGYIPHFSGRAGQSINNFFGVVSSNVSDLAELYACHIDLLVKRR